MSANDNNKKSTANEVRILADAIFNKCSAISGQSDRATILRLVRELGGIVTRAERTPASRSKASNDLLARAIVCAWETVRSQMA